MKCWTIILNENGEHTVTEGIEFERTDNPLLGILNAGGIQMQIVLPPNFEGRVLKYIPPISTNGQFIDLEYSKDEPNLTLKFPKTIRPKRILIHYKITGCLLEEVKEEDGRKFRYITWGSLEDDIYSYDSISEDRSSALLCAGINFYDSFLFNGFNLTIQLDEDCRPIVELLQSDDESDVQD
jgi:hypothetical protein